MQRFLLFPPRGKHGLEKSRLLNALHIDPVLTVLLLLLSGIGLLTLYSASGANTEIVLRHVVHLLIAFFAMFLAAQLSIPALLRWAPALYCLGVALLVLVLFAGDLGKGARRWLDLGVIRFQPSELLKLSLPLMLAGYLSKRPVPPRWPQLLFAGALLLLPVLLIARQPDLGTALMVGMVGFVVIFAAGMSWKALLSMAVLLVGSIPVLWYLLHDYQRQRILIFLDPQREALGAGYHIIQSTIAIGSGGLSGKGWQSGTQSQLEFLPERLTDFIFAVYCEEFGFVGASLLLGLYLMITWRGLYIASQAQTAFGCLLANALTISFFLATVVNIGMTSGQLPVVGSPLPLISLGGTAMLSTMIGFGLLMAIYFQRRFLSL